MKVHLDEDGDKRLVGRADVSEDAGPVHEVPPPGGAPGFVERFAVGTVTRLPEGGGAPVVERAVLLTPGRSAELLPGWQPLAT